VKRIDWTIVRTGATAGLLVVVPAAIIANRALGGRASNGWVWLFLLVVMAGFGLSGVVAGRLRSDTPMLHGALAAALACVVTQVFGLIVAVSGDGSVSLLVAPLALLLAVSAGVAGSLAGDRFSRRRRRLRLQTTKPT
jgi:CHASE2 domain-containing sensor protein